MPQVVAKLDNDEISPQLVDELCSIPCGHYRYITDKCKGAQGKAITNFNKQLPIAQGDLANELTKAPYNFDFLTMTEGYNEKGLKDALTDNIVKFLLELGNGFAFVGVNID